MGGFGRVWGPLCNLLDRLLNGDSATLSALRAARWCGLPTAHHGHPYSRAASAARRCVGGQRPAHPRQDELAQRHQEHDGDGEEEGRDGHPGDALCARAAGGSAAVRAWARVWRSAQIQGLYTGSPESSGAPRGQAATCASEAARTAFPPPEAAAHGSIRPSEQAHAKQHAASQAALGTAAPAPAARTCPVQGP